MENKHNFAGIIISVIVAVILLTVLPIVNSINVECPPCEECPSYNIGNVEVNPDFSSGNYIVDKGSYDYIDSATIIKDTNLIPENIKKDVNVFGVVGTYEEVGESSTYEYVLSVTSYYNVFDVTSDVYLTILFAPKNSQTIINDKPYYPYNSTIFINYKLAEPDIEREDYPIPTVQDYYYLFWEDFTESTLTIQAPFNPIDYECLGIFSAVIDGPGWIDSTFYGVKAYKSDEISSTSIYNSNIFQHSIYSNIYTFTLQGITEPFISSSGNYYYLPKLETLYLSIDYGDD